MEAAMHECRVLQPAETTEHCNFWGT